VWEVTVPPGQNYKMVADYWWDEDNETDGSGAVWSGVLTPGQVFTWYY